MDRPPAARLLSRQPIASPSSATRARASFTSRAMTRHVSSPAIVPTTLRMLDLVERARDRRCGAELRVERRRCSARSRAAAELREHCASAACGSGRRRSDSAGSDVARASERVVRLLEPELADVARDRRLRHRAAGGGERGCELELRADALARDDSGEQPLPLRLAEGPAVRLHGPSIDMRTFPRHSAWQDEEAC